MKPLLQWPAQRINNPPKLLIGQVEQTSNSMPRPDIVILDFRMCAPHRKFVFGFIMHTTRIKFYSFTMLTRRMKFYGFRMLNFHIKIWFPCVSVRDSQ